MKNDSDNVWVQKMKDSLLGKVRIMIGTVMHAYAWDKHT